MKRTLRPGLLAIVALAAGSFSLADSFKIDVSPIGIAHECASGVKYGINRVCISVTNDDRNEDDGDHAKPIKSFYFEFYPNPDCGWSHPVLNTPPNWDTDSGDVKPILPVPGQGPRRWMHWQTDDDEECLEPGEESAKPFCLTMVGNPQVFNMTTDTNDNDGDSVHDLLASVNLGGQDIHDINDTDFRTDTDGDGIVDEDETHSDPTKADTDDDGFPDGSDNCPGVDNPDQKDSDGDGLGDACDPDPEEKDADSDTLNDGRERVVGTDPENYDSDGDGRIDKEELEKDSDPNDPKSKPEFSLDGIDNDGFGLIDEDFDADDDGVDSLFDNCDLTPNEGQRDSDGDSEGDACDLDDGLLHFTALQGVEVAWQPDEGFLSYNLYRGSMAYLLDSGLYVQPPGSNPYAAWFCDLPLPSLLDGLVPESGELFFWLVSGNDADGVEHDLGTASNGDIRPLGPSCHQ